MLPAQLAGGVQTPTGSLLPANSVVLISFASSKNHLAPKHAPLTDISQPQLLMEF